jgi:hypothetical protein
MGLLLKNGFFSFTEGMKSDKRGKRDQSDFITACYSKSDELPSISIISSDSSIFVMYFSGSVDARRYDKADRFVLSPKRNWDKTPGSERP